MDKSSLVTVYISTYNRLSLLKRALASVINQTYTNLEIIVVDDSSTDDTQEFLKAIVQQDKRIKIFLKEKNGGACESRNIAIQNAMGEYITGLDDDDYFLPDRIENFVSNLSKDNENIILFDNPIIKVDHYPIITKKIKIMNALKPKKVRAKDLFFVNYIGNQVFVKTGTLKKYGGFDKNMPMWQDLECWYNLLKYSEGYALRLNSYTYVMDISHEMDRISNFKLEKGMKAFSYFNQKHKLSGRECIILFCQLYGYDHQLIRFQPLILRVLTRPNIGNILNTGKNIFYYFRKHSGL